MVAVSLVPALDAHRGLGGGAAGTAAVSPGLDRDRSAEGAEHPLGVIAAGNRFAHGRAPARAEPGEEQRRLDLGARHRQAVVEPAKARATDDERSPPLCARQHAGAHALEGLDDARHGPRAQRRIPGQDGEARPGGQDPGEETHRGAGVAAVDHLLGLGGLPRHSLDLGERTAARDARAEERDGGEARRAVVAGVRVEDAGRAAREPAEEDGAMGDRLVPGHDKCAAEVLLRLDAEEIGRA